MQVLGITVEGSIIFSGCISVSSYLADTPVPYKVSAMVFVVSPDWTLRTMVRAQLREANIEAMGMENTRDMAEALAGGLAPSLIVLDGVELKNAAARKALERVARIAGVLVVNSAVTPAPPVPGTEVMRRPVRIQDIVAWVLAKPRRTKR